VTVQAATLEVALRPVLASKDLDSSLSQPPEIVHVPRTRKPFVAAKGVAHMPSGSPPIDPKARDAALAAIGKARLWVNELLAGGSFAEFAKREGKGERHIRLLLPLAFTPPAVVRGLIDGTMPPTTVTGMAKAVPLSWAHAQAPNDHCW
jgi:hypothetical protein